MTPIVTSIVLLCTTMYLLNKISYDYMKRRYFHSKHWDLNICCGKTDGGGVNVDIIQHCEQLSNFILVEDVCNLPFGNKQFETVLCSHTAEHVDNPEEFAMELNRVGQQVYYVVPPLWDVAAAFNFFEHKWIFLTFKKQHTSLPPFIRLPFSRTWQKYAEQQICA